MGLFDEVFVVDEMTWLSFPAPRLERREGSRRGRQARLPREACPCSKKDRPQDLRRQRNLIMADTRSECWGDNTSARLSRGFLFCVGRRLRDSSREGGGSTGLLTLQPKIPTELGLGGVN
jgi:hypothetical protein